MLSLVVVALACAYSVAQRLAASAKCQGGFGWMYNSLNQSPCDVAYELASVCDSGPDSNPEPLLGGYVYGGPTPGYSNRCLCSSVYYSLLCGCGYCQGREYISWGWYTTNCTNRYHQTFPEPIPIGLKVQAWAYEDVENNGGTFNVTLAQSLSRGVESTHVPTNPPTETTIPSSNSKVPVIVGVVVGVICLAIITALCAFFMIRRKHKRRSRGSPAYRPALVKSPKHSEMTQSARNSPAPTSMFTPPGSPGKLYNPNDPSTFPTLTSFPSSSSPESQTYRQQHSPLGQPVNQNYTPSERNPPAGRPKPPANLYLNATPEL